MTDFFFLKLVECSIQMLIMDLYLVEYNFFGAFWWRLYLIHGTCIIKKMLRI